MERYALHFLACRAVVSMSTEWLTLKAAISMTTPLRLCACIFEPFPELSSIPPLNRLCAALRVRSMEWVLAFEPSLNCYPSPNGTLRARCWLAGRWTLHRGHSNTDQHQRVLESGIWGALTFCPCLDISSIAPMECHAFGLICLQGGGLTIYGTATLTNTNVYSNEASWVCSPSSLA